MEETLRVNYDMAIDLKLYVSAFRLAIRLDDTDKIKEVFSLVDDKLVKKQLCFMAARQRIVIPGLEEEEELQKVASN